VIFLQEAKDFVDYLDKKTRKKVFYNIWKARSARNPELFKKLHGNIWEFRTVYERKSIRLFAFWDKTDREDTLVVTPHGVIKKTGKIAGAEIAKAERLRKDYFENK